MIREKKEDGQKIVRLVLAQVVKTKRQRALASSVSELTSLLVVVALVSFLESITVLFLLQIDAVPRLLCFDSYALVSYCTSIVVAQRSDCLFRRCKGLKECYCTRPKAMQPLLIILVDFNDCTTVAHNRRGR
jgi:hypothetical protein